MNKKEKKKKRVGIFSLTCDEGCSIFLIEIFNEKLVGWLEKIEIGYFLSIKDHMEINDLDIALIEGVVSTQQDVEDVLKIREESKIIIAMGSCAITTMPSGQRNGFNDRQLKEIEKDLKKFKYLPKCVPISEVVKVDDQVSGCPILKEKFIEVFEKYL